MTLEQATKLVQQTLRQTVRSVGDASPRKQLKTFGVLGATLIVFKRTMLTVLRTRTILLTARELRFSETFTVSQVASLIATRALAKHPAKRTGDPWARPLKPRPPGVGHRGALAELSGTAAKKAAPRRTAKKAVAMKFSPVRKPFGEAVTWKTTTKKSVTKKAVAKKAVAKKAVAKKAVAKKAVAKKAVAKKVVERKAVAPRAPAKKTVSRKAGSKKATRKATVTEKQILRRPVKQWELGSSLPGAEPTGERASYEDPATDDASFNEDFGDEDRSPDMVFEDLSPEDSGDDSGSFSNTQQDIRASAEIATKDTLLTLESTPQMDLAKEHLAGVLYELEIYLDQKEAPDGAEVQKTIIQHSRGVTSIQIQVWFDCSSHLSVEDVPQDAVITVDTKTGVSDRLRATLRLLPTGGNGPFFLTAFFRYNGRPCGKITRYLVRTSASAQWLATTPEPDTDGEVILPRAGGSPSVAVEISGKAADIQVEVLKTDANDGRHFVIHCSTGKGSCKEAWNLPQESKELVNTSLQAFMEAAGNARVSKLRSAGLNFWDALPSKTRTFLLAAIEAGAESMAVLSEEPYIPWELMIPYRGLSQLRSPLGVELRIGRWVTGDYTSASQRIPMRSIYVVNPKTSGLKNSQKEVDFLKGLGLNPASEIVPANYDGIDAGLSGTVRDIVHFVCHGTTGNIQTLQLEAPDKLDCSQVRVMDGFRKAFENGGFAFLNACEVGGSVLSLAGVGGFANSFIQLGASGVIAPLWSVQDSAALTVSQLFYGDALQGIAFSDIMKRIRAKAYDEAIDSYAAYCFYGDPNALMSKL